MGKGVIHRNLILDLIDDKDVGTLKTIVERFSGDLKEVLYRPYQDGQTALHILSMQEDNQHLEQLEILLKNCAGPTETNSTTGNSETSCCNLPSEKCKKAVHALCGRTSLHMVVNAQDKFGSTPLHWTAANNSVQTAELLIQNGAHVNAQDEDGTTPLHYAAGRPNSVQTAELLIQNGADVNAQDNIYGRTPLHVAAMNYSVQTAELLLESGANVLLTDKGGRTPYKEAVLFGNRNVKELLERKMEEALLNTGETPIL